VITVWGRYVFQIADLLIDDSPETVQQIGLFCGAYQGYRHIDDMVIVSSSLESAGPMEVQR